jgi:hypothetical protein
MVAPLKPEAIDKALQRGSQAELDEFERLVSEQFESDPLLVTDEQAAQAQVKIDRLRELGKKLFG